MPVEIASRSLQGISDLTLTAPIRAGFVPGAVVPCTYATRLRHVLDTLRLLRTAARELAPVRPFTDVVERIQAIHSFRLALLPADAPGVPGRLLLAVTFDRGWDAYVRLLWDELGPFLDLIFSNCDQYVTAFDNSFEDYAVWIRRSQLDSPYFYTASALTTGDGEYLAGIEQASREGAGDAALAGLVTPDPMARAAAVRGVTRFNDRIEDLWLSALAALYRLVVFHRSDKADGDRLRRAACDLLRELDPAGIAGNKRERFREPLEWLGTPDLARRPRTDDPRQIPLADIQRGILASHDERDPEHPITHACLLMLEVVVPERARAFLRALDVASEADTAQVPGTIYTNVAFTAGGLAQLGVPAATIAGFPAAFREGMPARAGLLGDVRGNHPDNWRTPRRGGTAPDNDHGARIALSAVDIVLVLRVREAVGENDHVIAGNPAHPLAGHVAKLEREAEANGIRLLAIEPMLREDWQGQPISHFGFADGISQPIVPAGSPTPVPPHASWSDVVEPGEILGGFRNGRGDRPPVADPLRDGGSFLVVRKLGQSVEALDAIKAAAGANGLDAARLVACMIGRETDGTPLVAPHAGPTNDFVYASDPAGVACPLQSHIRRANPRTPSRGGVMPPRIMRRGMPYGPAHRAGEPAGIERGTLFMAYCGDIAEQFEVIQRWMSGGNSTGIGAAQSDPLLGVPLLGDARVFRVADAASGAGVQRIALDAPGRAPLCTLEWGAYLFAPSLSALRTEIAGERAEIAPPSRLLTAGVAILDRLTALAGNGGDGGAQAWREAIQDIDRKDTEEGAALWAAIRGCPDGTVRTPIGVIVAGPAEVEAVFLDRERRYAVGYAERMKDSFGEIYLGLNAGDDYDRESRVPNAAIGAIDLTGAFETASAATTGVIAALLAEARPAGDARELLVDLGAEVVEPALALLARHYFGLPDDFTGRNIVTGGWCPHSVAERRPVCPGDFVQPSAHLFRPDPTAAIVSDGEAQGRALRAAAMNFVRTHRAAAGGAPGCIAAPMFAGIADDDLLARTLVGVMIGFVPTVLGNLRSVLVQWLNTGSLWRLQETLCATRVDPPVRRAELALRRAMVEAMQRAPVPDAVWRKVAIEHRLGGETLAVGEEVAVSIVSATQAHLAAGRIDDTAIFGGTRGANGPTHACPGYEMAIGTMLGILAAILDAGMLRAGPLPLTVGITAPVPSGPGRADA